MNVIKLIERHHVLHSYIWKLSVELLERFGKKSYYTVDEVTHTCRVAGFDMTFLPYAHALYSTRADFDAHYVPLNVPYTYDGLRRIVSRRFFHGVLDFDAERITGYVTSNEEPDDGNFHESWAGLGFF